MVHSREVESGEREWWRWHGNEVKHGRKVEDGVADGWMPTARWLRWLASGREMAEIVRAAGLRCMEVKKRWACEVFVRVGDRG
ncbi:hypothetical protein AMTR_s00167p00031490 [Amborella trichopoda]|uniref:Uncharacterized protein n=1 Tax=Amborella trichopoda TaxID=13333 RepID=W1PS61_AMBTC|nr:hypothetical protein AMTR_s00167p00031490 [Amborella trichopoda]